MTDLQTAEEEVEMKTPTEAQLLRYPILFSFYILGSSAWSSISEALKIVFLRLRSVITQTRVLKPSQQRNSLEAAFVYILEGEKY
jgi:hypothetical protein